MHKRLFYCQYRWKIPAKHKGEIEMYFVESILPELSINNEGRIPNSQFLEKYNNLKKTKIN